MSHRPAGFRVQVLLESTFAEDDKDRTRAYRLSVDSATGSVLAYEDGGMQELTGPSGLWRLETEETLDHQAASLVLAPSLMARVTFGRIEPQDHLRIVLHDGRRPAVVFDGFVSSFAASTRADGRTIQGSLSLQAHGLKKLLEQAIFNWQASLSAADDIGVSAEGAALYQKLQGDGRPPQAIIAAFLEAAFARVVKLQVGDEKLAPGGWFRLAEGRNWSCAYGAKFPLAYQLLYQAWGGSLWNLFESLAEADLHELFVTYLGEPGQERPALVFRPRPFPGAPGDDEGWKALPLIKPGLENLPGADAVLQSRNDAVRANAFHWAWTGFTDRDVTAFASKAQVGWWADRRAIARYGFSGKQVSTQLLPSGGGDDPAAQAYLTGVETLLKRVSYQDAPLVLLESHARSYPLLLGIRPGMRVEDWSEGFPSTGYATSVTHRLQLDPERIEAATQVSLTRALGGVDAEAYPDKVRARLKLERISYLKPLALEAAQDAVKAPPHAQVQRPFHPGGIPYGATIGEAAAKHGIPSAALAAILKQESGFNTLAKAKSSSASGIAQMLKGTADNLGKVGCKNADGTPYSAKDRFDAQKSINAAAFLMKRDTGILEAHGLKKSNPAYWAWVAYAYNQGSGKASEVGPSVGWNLAATAGLPVTGQNPPSYWLNFNRTLGAMGGVK